MDNNLIEKYKKEMLDMYSKAKPTIQINQNSPDTTASPSGNGSLSAVVTTLREIYPVKGAKVTIFTGNYNNMDVIDSGFTDESGKSPVFILTTPDKELSESPGISDKPYSSYNMLIEADGYLDNIHLNIPVFSGVQSVQKSNMMLFETAGENKGPQIFDESEQFTL